MVGRKHVAYGGQQGRPQPQTNGAYPVYDDTVTPPHASTEKERLPHHNGNPRQNHSWIKEDGDAGRRGFHPLLFLLCCFKSSSRLSRAVNVLWPFVPAAIAVVSTKDTG